MLERAVLARIHQTWGRIDRVNFLLFMDRLKEGKVLVVRSFPDSKVIGWAEPTETLQRVSERDDFQNPSECE